VGWISGALAGLAAGGAYALLGVCAVVTFRMVAVLNFTGAAIGAFGTYVMVILYEHGVALALAAVTGLVAGGLAAAAIGAVLLIWFAEAPAATKAGGSVAMLVGGIAVGLHAFGAQHPHRFPSNVDVSAFSAAGVGITWSALITLGLALGLTTAAWLFLRRTRAGLQLLALSERPTSAELLAIPVRRLGLAVWTATGVVTTLAIMVIAPERATDFMSLSMLIVPAFAAALIGLFRSFWLTVAGGVALGMLEGMASHLVQVQQYRGVLPFLVILLVLLWTQRRERWGEAR
jgi:branched-chain amino acid transport system permease protein